MSIGDWAHSAATEALTAAAGASIALAGVACVLGFFRFVVHWPVHWFWILLPALISAALGALAFCDRIPKLSPQPPVLFG